ncbi:hypothetical protein D1007_49351 [Hordeum vulgare]|nr:hypothetical protein D1007_49351 [Hordeum vulgare]
MALDLGILWRGFHNTAAARVLPPPEPQSFLQSNPAHRPCRRPPPRFDLLDDDPSQLLAAAAAKKAAAPAPAKPASKQPAKTPPPAEDARGSREDVARRGRGGRGGGFGRTGRRRDHGDTDANGFKGGYVGGYEAPRLKDGW